ncbi:MAG TPA: ABC transporter permease [Bacillota bacterium]|nr:ABC transporter permease [Bacillota bacterium]
MTVKNQMASANNVLLKNSKKASRQALTRSFGIIVITFIVAAVVSVLSPWFLTSENIINVLRQSSFLLLVALAETLAIITAGIDLSVSSVVSISGCLTAFLVLKGYSLPLAIVAGIAIGTFLGAINAILITVGKMEPYLATLSMQIIGAGGILYATQGVPVVPFNDAFTVLGRGYLGSLPVPIVVAGVIAVLVHLMLTSTVFGRHIYAVGGNPKAARVSGVNVSRVIALTYMISGSLAGLSGVMLASRLASGQPSAGVGMEVYAIASSVVGGASFFGGEGTIYGTVAGVLLIGIIGNALNLLNVSSFLHQVIIGGVIVVTVVIDRRMKRR